MKKKLHLLLIIFFLTGSGAGVSAQVNNPESKASPFVLDLKISGFTNGYVKLLGIFGEQNFGIDSAFVNAQGQAAFRLDTSLPAGMYFIAFPDNSIVQLLFDKTERVSLQFDKADVVNTMVTKGSPDNELLYINLKTESGINKKMDSVQQLLGKTEKGSKQYQALQKELQKTKDERKAHIKWFADNHPQSFFTKFKLAGQNPDIPKPMKADGTVDDQLYVYNYRHQFWNGFDFTDERLLRTPVYFNKLKRYLLELTPQTIDSVIKYADRITMLSKGNRELFKYTANWIALHYKEARMLGRESVYVFMIDKFWTADQAFWSKDYEVQRLRMQAAQMKPSLIGQTGHDIKSTNEIGIPVSLYDIKAPVTIVYAFSYDCENCLKETPKMVNLYRQWRNKGLDFFTICIDGEEDKWKEYLRKNNMTFRNIFDPENKTNFRTHYYFEVTPGIFVLDKNHKIIATNVGADSLPVILEQVLGKL